MSSRRPSTIMITSIIAESMKSAYPATGRATVRTLRPVMPHSGSRHRCIRLFAPGEQLVGGSDHSAGGEDDDRGVVVELVGVGYS